MSDKRSYAERVINEAFSKYYTEIYRFCMSYLTKDKTSIDDCVQEAFLVLYKKLLDGDKIANTRAYLYKIAENVVHSKLRELKKHSEHINIEDVIDLPNQSEDMTERLSFDEYSRQISDALTDKEAELFRLRYIDDMSIEDIAELLGLSFSATGTRLHRLKKKISIIIKDIL